MPTNTTLIKDVIELLELVEVKQKELEPCTHEPTKAALEDIRAKVQSLLYEMITSPLTGRMFLPQANESMPLVSRQHSLQQQFPSA